MTEQAQHVPAGWYPSTVEGEQRWWDGYAWTTHFQPTPAVVIAQPVIAPKAKNLDYWRGSRAGSLIIGIVCVFMLPGTAVMTWFALLDGSVNVLKGIVFLLGFTAFGVISFLNFWGLGRQNAAKAALLAESRAAVHAAAIEAGQEPPTAQAAPVA